MMQERYLSDPLDDPTRGLSKAKISGGEGYEDRMTISLLSGRGTGNEQILIYIYPRDFDKVASLMLQTNAEVAIRAFGAALRSFEVDEQKEG